MGAHFSGCISCVERDHDEHGVKAVKLNAQHSDDGATVDKHQHSGEEEAKLNMTQTSASVADIESQILEAQINAIVKSHTESQKPSVAREPDDELQGRINAIVNARKERSLPPYSPEYSPGYSPGCSLENTFQYSPEYSPGYSPENALQAQMNAIVWAHSSSLKEQRRLGTTEWASPAQSLADADLQYYANAALMRARERGTPAKSSQPGTHLAEDDDDIVPCQLNFADGNDTHGDSTLGIQKDIAPTIQAEPELALKVDVPKVEARSFNVSEIPSPTRNRAKRQQKVLWEEVQNVSLEIFDEEAQAQQKMIDAKVDLEKELKEEEEAQKITNAKKLQELENKAQIAAMDEMCIDAFLESVRKCAWRERVRTPIKGTNLYVKHMRPCRPCGTSVDVKDSSFRYLGEFLKFLEKEGLLRLKPGLSDPVVTEIFYDACHKYRHAPSASTGLSAPAVCTLPPSGAPSSTAFQYQ